MPSYLILKTITCGFEPKEIRRADEFPKGFDLPRLLELGSIKAIDPIDTTVGKPISAELLDQIEDLNDSLHTVKAHYEAKCDAAQAALNEKAAELAKSTATITSLSEQLAAVHLEREAEVADLKAKLAAARSELEAKSKPPEDDKETKPKKK